MLTMFASAVISCSLRWISTDSGLWRTPHECRKLCDPPNAIPILHSHQTTQKYGLLSHLSLQGETRTLQVGSHARSRTPPP